MQPEHSRSIGATVRIVLVIFGGAAVSALSGGCKPDLGAPPSLISAPQLLDLRVTPAEVKPGADVSLEILAGDPGGPVTAPAAWTICRSPKPPAESNAVSQACVDQSDDGPPISGAATVTVPAEACSLFGPLTPPAQNGQPAVRPRDPDPTGGFYQPIRAAVRGLAGAPQDLLGFALVRISCALANAPAEFSKAFNDPVSGYHANVAPKLQSVTLTDPSGVEAPVYPPGAAVPAPVTVHPGETIAFRANWASEDAEVFPVFDIAARTLVDTREAMRVSWFTTAGEFVHDRTGRSSDDPALFTDNTWTVSAAQPAGPVYFWVVLRDSRGGSDAASFAITVAP